VHGKAQDGVGNKTMDQGEIVVEGRAETSWGFHAAEARSLYETIAATERFAYEGNTKIRGPFLV